MRGKKRGVGFNYAFNGMKNAFFTERNFKIHLACAVIVILFSILLKLAMIEWISIIFAIGFVLVAEMFNTAIELLLDYLNPSVHPSAKMIKDLSAGAVLIAAITASLVGVIIFVPKLIDIFL